MNIGLDKIIHKDSKVYSDEYLDAMLNRDSVSIDLFEQREAALENLRTLRNLCKNGKADLASAIAGFEVSEESLTDLIKSEEGFASAAGATAMAAADIGTFGIAGNIKQVAEGIMETTQQLSKKFYKNQRRLKGRKISDEDIVNTRCPALRSFNSWMFRAQVIFKIHQAFNSITPKNAFDVTKKIAEYCNQLGWRPRGLFKFTGVHLQSTGTALRERWAVSSDKAGKLGWNAAKFNQAVGVCEKLLNIRVSDLVIDVNVAKQIESLNKSGMTFRQINKALTAVTYCTYHEIGKLVRCINKFMTKIDADYDEDDEV